MLINIVLLHLFWLYQVTLVVVSMLFLFQCLPDENALWFIHLRLKVQHN